MKHSLFFFLLVLMVTACQSDPHQVRLSGKFDKIDNAEFYLFSETGEYDHIDTIRIEKGKFDHTFHLDEPTVFTLQYPNNSQTHFVAQPGKHLEVKGSANKLKTVDISGSAMNERLSEFRIKTYGMAPAKKVLAAQQYIRDHANSLDAAIVLYDELKNAEGVEPKVQLSLLNLLLDQQPRSPYVQWLNRLLRPLWLTAVGQSVATFSGRTLYGKTYTCSDSAHTPTLIFAWASWNHQSLASLDYIRHIQEAYGSKIRMVGISLDPDTERPIRYLHQYDSIACPILYDGKMFQSPLVYHLGIRYLPTNIVLDKRGKIVARDLPFDQVEAVLQKYIR